MKKRLNIYEANILGRKFEWKGHCPLVLSLICKMATKKKDQTFYVDTDNRVYYHENVYVGTLTLKAIERHHEHEMPKQGLESLTEVLGLERIVLMESKGANSDQV